MVTMTESGLKCSKCGVTTTHADAMIADAIAGKDECQSVLDCHDWVEIEEW